MKRRDFGALSLALLCIPSSAFAQANKTRKIIVGFPPGQATDVIARMLAEYLRTELGESMIVENRPGLSATMGAGQVARSAPNGATILLSPVGALAIAPHLSAHVTYNTLTSFEPVGLVCDLPLVLVVNPALPVKTLPEFIAYAKAHPDKLSHSSSGNGTISHLAMEDLKRIAGMRIVHVPYQGSAPAMVDLMAGNIHVALDTVAVTRSHIESGRLRLIAVGSLERMANFPDTPTIAEQGYSGFEASGWLGMLLPAETPPAIVDRLSVALNKVVRLPEVKQKFAALGMLPRPSTPAEFKKLLAGDYVRWGKVVVSSGLKAD